MYGCNDPYIVYGWREGNRENVLDYSWFEDSLIYKFATDVVKYHAGEAVYGIPCKLDSKTGELSISETNKKIVVHYYNKLIQYYIDTGKKLPYPEIGFYSAISGDIEWSEHYEYNPEEEEEDDDDEDEDEEDDEDSE